MPEAAAMQRRQVCRPEYSKDVQCTLFEVIGRFVLAPEKAVPSLAVPGTTAVPRRICPEAGITAVPSLICV